MPGLELTELHRREHDQAAGIDTKKVSIFGYDPVTGTPRRLRVDSDGNLSSGGFDANATITTDISTPGTIIETDGVKTLTTVITSTAITETWSTNGS